MSGNVRAPRSEQDRIREGNMQKIAVANRKGGVGKTTSAVHIAAGLALAGRRVRRFDTDGYDRPLGVE